MSIEAGPAKGQVPPGKRATYPHPLAYYAPLLNRSVRTLKGLIAIGRDATPPELPPFDDLPRLKDWWVRHMKNRVPDDFNALSAAPAATPSPITLPVDVSAGPLFAAAAASAGAASSALPQPTQPAPVVGATGYSAALRRARNAEATAGELYTSLLRQANDPQCTPENRTRLLAESEQARRGWEKNAEQLRSYEKDAASILASSGSAWDAVDVIAANEVVHLVLCESIRNLLRRVRPKLSACATPADEDKLWNAEVEAMFTVLRENKFTAPPADSPVTTPPSPAPADVASA